MFTACFVEGEYVVRNVIATFIPVIFSRPEIPNPRPDVPHVSTEV